MPLLKAWLQKFIVITCSIVVAFVVVEIAARFMRLAPTVHRIRTEIKKSSYRLSENPVLGYVHKENYRDKNADLLDSYPFINSHGQRDIERTYEKKKGKKRIIVLGDSVVEGLGIRDVGNTITRKLENLLQDENIEVLNFGVAGYSTRGEVELLKTRGLKYSPDIVLVVFLMNDFFNFNSRINHYKIDRPIFVNEMFIHWHFFRFISMKFNLFGFRHETDPNYYVKRHLRATGDNNVENGLELLSKISNENGIQTAILIWPQFSDKHIVNRNSPESKVIYLNDARKLKIELIAEKYQIPSFRLSDYFQEYLKELVEKDGGSVNPKKYFTTDGTHPTRKGAEVTAKAIETILMTNPHLFHL